MIAGIHKCGTTSLQRALGRHSGVVTHEQMEMTFFSSTNDEYSAPVGDRLVERYFPAAADPGGPPRLLLGKHAGAFSDATGLERIHGHNPECRIILTVRDPVERAHSAYLMESAAGVRQPPFGEVVEEVLSGRLPDSDWRMRIYLAWGRYDEHLAAVSRVFGPDQVRIFPIDWLDVGGPLADLEAWLGLPPEPLDPPRRENVATEARSPRLAALTHGLLRESGSFKRAARKVVPPRMGTWIGGRLRALNRRPVTERVAIEPEVRDLLRAYFDPHVTALERETGLELRDLWGWRQPARLKA
jgi:hypothetical protein